jgi:hypothetical protein
MPWFSSPAKTTAADPDPVGVVSGYRYPRGPMGQTGYPGSNSQVPIGPQDPLTVTPGLVQQPFQQQTAQMQGNPQEFYGGLIQQGPAAQLPVQRPRERRWYPRLSTNTQATQQRNNTFFGGQQALPNGQDRYVYGGYRSYSFERPMPLTRNHLRVKPGASGYDGSRFYAVNQGQGSAGAIGTSRSTLSNRPTVFEEPAPWSSNFYDTTASTGAPGQPGTAKPVRQVYVSPNVRTNTNGGTWRRGG